MKILTQTPKEFLCIKCHHFLFTSERNNILNTIILVCMNDECLAFGKGGIVKLETEIIEAKDRDE